MFAKLRDVLRPKQLDSPLGLSKPEIECLQRLSTSDEWQVYLKALDAVSNLQGEVILASADPNALLTARGTVLGLRRAASLVDEIVSLHSSIQKNERSRQSTAEAAAERRKLALHGSPAWSASLAK